MARKTARKAAGNGDLNANVGFETQLWAAADKMRGHMGAFEYKYVALGLILLKYILRGVQRKLNAYHTWYNRHRPHGALGVRTPDEAGSGTGSSRRRLRSEVVVRQRRSLKCRASTSGAIRTCRCCT